jgi:hypothetical protein
MRRRAALAVVSALTMSPFVGRSSRFDNARMAERTLNKFRRGTALLSVTDTSTPTLSRCVADRQALLSSTSITKRCLQ